MTQDRPAQQKAEWMLEAVQHLDIQGITQTTTQAYYDLLYTAYKQVEARQRVIVDATTVMHEQIATHMPG